MSSTGAVSRSAPTNFHNGSSSSGGSGFRRSRSRTYRRTRSIVIRSRSTTLNLRRLSGGSSSEICRQAKHDLPDDRRAGPTGSDVGERSLGMLNAGSPRAFERGNSRQGEPLFPEMRRDGRERAPHRAVVSRPEREGDEAEAREAGVHLIQVELERLRNRSCLLLGELRHRPIAASSRQRLVTQARRFRAGFVAGRSSSRRVSRQRGKGSMCSSRSRARESSSRTSWAPH